MTVNGVQHSAHLLMSSILGLSTLLFAAISFGAMYRWTTTTASKPENARVCPCCPASLCG